METDNQALQSPYLTVNQVARHARVSPSTVRRWIRLGHLPAAKAGVAVNSKIVVSHKDIERFLWAAPNP